MQQFSKLVFWYDTCLPPQCNCCVAVFINGIVLSVPRSIIICYKYLLRVMVLDYKCISKRSSHRRSYHACSFFLSWVNTGPSKRHCIIKLHIWIKTSRGFLNTAPGGAPQAPLWSLANIKCVVATYAWCGRHFAWCSCHFAQYSQHFEQCAWHFASPTSIF